MLLIYALNVRKSIPVTLPAALTPVGIDPRAAIPDAHPDGEIDELCD